MDAATVSSITNVVDWTQITIGIGAIAQALAVVYVAYAGARLLVDQILDYQERRQIEKDDFEDWMIEQDRRDTAEYHATLSAVHDQMYKDEQNLDPNDIDNYDIHSGLDVYDRDGNRH